MNRTIKQIAIIAAVIAVTSTVVHAQMGGAPFWNLQLEFGSMEHFIEDYQPDVFGPDGLPVPMTSRWTAQIVLASNPDVVLYQTHHTGQGHGWGFWDYHGELDGCPFQVGFLPWWSMGQTIMTKIYNHEFPSQATMFALVGPTNLYWVLDKEQPPPLPQMYNFGTVSQSDWQVIPEPGSAALLALGAGGAVMIRRWRRRLAQD